MKLHIAASKNDAVDVHQLASLIKKAGHEVWDWTQGEIPSEYGTGDVSEQSEPVTKFMYNKALARSCAAAEMVICFGEGDFESGREIGVAYVLDIPVIAVPNMMQSSFFTSHLNDEYSLHFLCKLLKYICPLNGFYHGISAKK